MKAFFDSNIVAHAHDRRDIRKHTRAMDLLAAHADAGTPTVSTQVLAESCSILRRKRLLNSGDAFAALQALAVGRVVPADCASVMRGLQLSRRYQLSSWDGLIVQATLAAGCTTQYTEDLQAGQRYGEVEVGNPFADAAHESPVAYRTKVRAKPAARPAARRKRVR